MLTHEQRVEFARRTIDSLENFVRVYFVDHTKHEIPAFHKEIYSLLTNKKRIVIAAPRGFAKSTVCSVFYPAWLATYGHAKDICIISASENLAVELLRKIKMTFESNVDYLSIFGDVRSQKWTENHIILANGVNIRAKGAGGQIRGFRPDVVILDDIETDESVVSEEQRKKLKEWLFKACLNTLLPEGQFVVVGTVLNQLSVLSDLLETPNGWEKRRYTAYTDGIQEKGHELWQDARPHEWLEQRKREIGTFAFSAEFMNDPKSDETAPIRSEQIRFWEELPKQYSGVIAVDPAYSEDERSDYKVAVLVLIDHHSNRYLSHYIRTHTSTGDFIDRVLNMWLNNKYITGVGIPNSGVEKSFFESFVKRAEERKLYPPVVELRNVFTTQSGGNVRSKKNRIIATLQPLFENGKYFIHADHQEAREELLTIGSSRWDDLVDAMAYAEQIIQPYFETPETVEYDRYGSIKEKVTIGETYGY
jgi:hypothetical protein